MACYPVVAVVVLGPLVSVLLVGLGDSYVALSQFLLKFGHFEVNFL